jgi:hypothetical protein
MNDRTEAIKRRAAEIAAEIAAKIYAPLRPTVVVIQKPDDALGVPPTKLFE